MKNKTIIIGSVVVLIGLGAYFVLKPKKAVVTDSKETETKPEVLTEGVVEPAKSVAPAPQTSKPLDKKKMLGLGSKGAEVKELQKKLGSLFVDGDFGAKTQAVLNLDYGVSNITLEQLEKMIPKKQYVKTIYNRLDYTGSKSGLYSMDLEFLKKWSSAISQGNSTFEYTGSKGLQTFDTKGGKSIQPTQTFGGGLTF
jgi:hypothetical protein